MQRASDLAFGLLARGIPVELLPQSPGVEPPAPVKMVRARALEKCVAGNTLRESGDTFLVPEDEVGGCVVLAGSEDDKPAPDPIERAASGKPKAPPWTTQGFLQKHAEEMDAQALDLDPVRPKAADVALIDKILTPTPKPPKEDASQ